MQYRTLGRTGIKVSPYALGAMMFGPIGNADHEDAITMIHKALDAGVNLVDTADAYSQGAYVPPSISTPTLRRRPIAERAAA